MLVPYDQAWPERFAEYAAELRAHGRSDWTIEHIGSTSILGMQAKPIIDLAVRIRDRAEVESCMEELGEAGWRVGSSVRSHLVLVRESDGIRSAIAHFFRATEWEVVSQRLLRDWLRTHPADAAQYSRAKDLAAAAAESHGTGAYNAAKAPMIQEIVDRARAARGLPTVPVSDR